MHNFKTKFFYAKEGEKYKLEKQKTIIGGYGGGVPPSNVGLREIG